MPMSTITVAGISPTLKVLGATQQFNYTQEVSIFQITNSFIPTALISSKFNYELRNNLFSGFRWIHLTNNTDTYGSLTLQNFVNAQSVGNDMLQFNSNGINIFVPINFNNNILTSGTWNGNTINVSYGGTGINTTTPYSVICGGTTATGALQSVSGLGTSGQVLTSQGPGLLPTWVNSGSGSVTSITAGTGLTGGTITTSGTISLNVPVSLANGGTNATLTASNGGIFYSTATAGAVLNGTSTANQVLLSGANAAPTWSSVTYPSTTTINQLLYSSDNNVLNGLATTNNGILFTSGTGVPSIGNILPTAVQGNITSVGTITSGTWNGNTINVSYGGTGINTTTPYSVICGGTTATGALQSVSGLGTSGQVLTSQGPGLLPTWSSSLSNYLLLNGTSQMTGNLDLNSNNLINAQDIFYSGNLFNNEIPALTSDYKLNLWYYVSTTATFIGSVFTASTQTTAIGGTPTQIPTATTNWRTRKSGRINCPSTTLADGARSGYIGTATFPAIYPQTGWFFTFEFSITDTNTATTAVTRMILGFGTTTTIPTLNSTVGIDSLQNMIGIGHDLGDSVLYFYSRGPATGPLNGTKIATTFSCATPSNKIFSVTFFNPTNSNDIVIKIYDQETRTSAYQKYTLGLTTTPVNNVALIPIWMRAMATSGGTNNSATLGLNGFKWYTL